MYLNVNCSPGFILGVFSKNQHEKDSSGVSPFQAVATAMAGTIGTGSIAGVATAIVSGGPGAIFWMWISALLGMVTKYAEIVLSLRYREKNSNLYNRHLLFRTCNSLNQHHLDVDLMNHKLFC